MESLFVATEKKITLDKFFSQVKIVPEFSVQKILNSNVRVCMIDADCQNGMIALSGKVFAEVVYLNAENNICASENVIEFIEKQRSDFSLSDVFAVDEVVIESVNVVGSDIVCVLSHSAKISGIYNYEIPQIEAKKDEFMLSTKQTELSKLVCSCEDNFVIAEEVEKDFSNMEILQKQAKAVLNSCEVKDDKVVLEGKVVAEIISLADGNMVSFAQEFAFKQEIVAENAKSEMFADANVVAKNIMVTPESKEGKTTLVFAIDVYAKNYVYEKMTYEFVADMFSLKNELQLTYDFAEIKNVVLEKSESESFMIQTDISNIEDFDDVLTVGGATCRLLSVFNEESKATVNVEVSAVAYLKTTNSTTTIPVSKTLNFEIQKDVLNFVDDVDFAVSVLSHKVKAGKDLEVVFKAEIQSKHCVVASEKFVKMVEEKQEKSNDFFGIKVYVSKENQTVFDVAKILNVSPEVIRNQNQVEDVFESGQKIYVYSPVNLA